MLFVCLAVTWSCCIWVRMSAGSRWRCSFWRVSRIVRHSDILHRTLGSGSDTWSDSGFRSGGSVEQYIDWHWLSRSSGLLFDFDDAKVIRFFASLQTFRQLLADVHRTLLDISDKNEGKPRFLSENEAFLGKNTYKFGLSFSFCYLCNKNCEKY